MDGRHPGNEDRWTSDIGPVNNRRSEEQIAVWSYIPKRNDISGGPRQTTVINFYLRDKLNNPPTPNIYPIHDLLNSFRIKISTDGVYIALTQA